MHTREVWRNIFQKIKTVNKILLHENVGPQCVPFFSSMLNQPFPPFPLKALQSPHGTLLNVKLTLACPCLCLSYLPSVVLLGNHTDPPKNPLDPSKTF